MFIYIFSVDLSREIVTVKKMIPAKGLKSESHFRLHPILTNLAAGHKKLSASNGGQGISAWISGVWRFPP